MQRNNGETRGELRSPPLSAGLMCADTMFLTLDGARRMNRVYCNLQHEGRGGGDNAPCDAYAALNNIRQRIVSWNLCTKACVCFCILLINSDCFLFRVCHSLFRSHSPRGFAEIVYYPDYLPELPPD